MARIPDVEIERLVMGFGVELRRHGANQVGGPRRTSTTATEIALCW